MQKASNLEKAASIISYFTMGIAGLIWIIASYILKKKPRPFLLYNLLQSMVISVSLGLFHAAVTLLLQISAVIPLLNVIGAFINTLLSVRITFLGLAFNIIEIIVFALLLYISAGVLISRIFYVPFLTKIMGYIMRPFR